MRKHYHRECLKHHPDKGGDVERFNAIYDTFESIRELVQDGKIRSFGVAKSIEDVVVEEPRMKYSPKGGDGAAKRPHPSYAYFEEAMDAGVALYMIELAKSGRSSCARGDKCCQPPLATTSSAGGMKAKGKKPASALALASDLLLIQQGTVRIGTIDGVSGKYGRFVHLACWRVPQRIWSGLPQPGNSDFGNIEAFVFALATMNEVIFKGFSSLPESNRYEVARFCMNSQNWAKAQIKKLAPGFADLSTTAVARVEAKATAKASTLSSAQLASEFKAAAAPASTSQALVPTEKKEKFLVPVPGLNGAIANAFAKQTCVLTGIFPKAGGGMGLNLGKDKMRECIEKFGGRVTSSVSGKTTMLIVGDAPGATKVEAARVRKIKMLSFENTIDLIHGRFIEGEKPLMIGRFSSGWGGNGKIYKWGDARLAAAAGVAPTKKAIPASRIEPLALPSSSAAAFPSSSSIKSELPASAEKPKAPSPKAAMNTSSSNADAIPSILTKPDEAPKSAGKPKTPSPEVSAKEFPVVSAKVSPKVTAKKAAAPPLKVAESMKRKARAVVDPYADRRVSRRTAARRLP